MNKYLLGTTVVTAALMCLLFALVPTWERNYQGAMDPLRQKHARQIFDVVREYTNKTGHLPFQAQAIDTPFMVLIGHSPEEENFFANSPPLMRNATWTHATDLEALLERELGRSIRLPRDPQTVPTFAPNVYLYFMSGNQMTVVAHLNAPTTGTVEYQWRGRPFHSYTICYAFEPSASRLASVTAANKMPHERSGGSSALRDDSSSGSP